MLPDPRIVEDLIIVGRHILERSAKRRGDEDALQEIEKAFEWLLERATEYRKTVPWLTPR
jgi:hypothetical protein